MADLKKVTPCPNCRFANRSGDVRCLMCKTELPRSSAAPTVERIRPSEADLQPEPSPAPALTKRLTKAASAEAIAWVCCDPLPPIPLVPGKLLVVGRQDTCDLVLPHKEVSRSHAVFKIAGRQITLEDQGSSNGCHVNGQRRASTICKVGDVIQIGPYEIEIRATGDHANEEGEQETSAFDVTRLASGARNASMTGKLADVPLVEILQQIEFNAKTCTLTLSDGRKKGELVFAAGRPQRAHFGGEHGMEAARAMLRLRDGRFVLSSEVEPGEASLSTTVTALLLEASREIDEAGLGREEPPAAELD